MLINRYKQTLSCLVLGLSCVAAFTMPSAVWGQANVDGLVATGTAKSEAMANRMRVTLTIKAKGADMEKAIEILKKRQKNAKIKMEKLGVIEDSIEFDSISLGSGGARQAQITQAMNSQARGDKRLERMMKVKPPATVQVSVSADWKLNAELDEVEILIAADKLKSKIMAADIESASEEDELSAAQEELAAEMAEMANRYGNSGEASGPKFSYVRVVSADEVKKLFADAVNDAKQNAQQLAESTGVKLGPIYRVASRDTATVPDYYDPYDEYPTRSTQEPKTDEAGTLYAVSDTPKVTVSRTISFAFRIKE